MFELYIEKMATSDIQKQAVFDARIVQLPPRYAVDKGAMSVTNSPYNAIAASTSQHTYNINVPSQNVFVDRAVDWTSTVALAFSVAVAAPVAGEAVLQMGRDAALAAFPLHELTQTMTATINDTSVVINTDTVLHEVLRLTDYKKNRLTRHCPTMLDRFASYNDCAGANANPLAGYLTATESAEVPNGAWWDLQFVNPNNNLALSGSGSYVSGGVTVEYVNGIPVCTEGQLSYPVAIRFTSTEKLVLSPFIFADSAEWETGLFGVNNIQLVMNLKSDVSRVLRSTTFYGRTVSSIQYLNAGQGAFQNSKVNVQYLTPSLDLPLPAKSVVPYMEFPRYINASYAVGQTQLQSQTIVLPQIPDMLIIYAKPQAYAATEGDWYFPITKISINFDNFAGLLSSHTQQQLYQMSVHNGLEMDYNEWSGAAYAGSAYPGEQPAGYIQTVGGPLILKPGQDFGLQSGQAPSLIGNFTLQFNVDIANRFGSAVAPVLYVIAVNSGFFETLAGSSRIIKGVLSEADIISAEPIMEMSRDGLNRMVGHGFFSKLGSLLSKGVDIYTKTKPVVSAIKGMLPEGKVKDVLGKVGYGMAGAAMPAGAGKKSLSQRLM